MIGDALHPTFARPLHMSSARQMSFALAFLGLAAIAIGCFVPVADAGSVDFARLSGNSLSSSAIGWLTLLLCGVLVMTLARSLQSGEPTWGPMFGGLLVVTEAVYVGAVELTTCPVAANVVESSACQAASPGVGLFMIGGGGAALALAGLELAPWRQSASAGNPVVTAAAAKPDAVVVTAVVARPDAVPGDPASPTGMTDIGTEPAAAPVSHARPGGTTMQSPAGPSLDTKPATGADVGSHVAAVLAAADEAARQIVAEARAEAARIASTVEWFEQANAESQRRLDEEAANLLRFCRAAEKELMGALRALSDVTGSPLLPIDRHASEPTAAGDAADHDPGGKSAEARNPGVPVN